mmetsp:Transcript_96136/g.286926  ORF Transcript_96136/g.286926 Transcript_96136/m.286926 type:complete len:235 (+) Transcript_96136:769-1473(+)
MQRSSGRGPEITVVERAVVIGLLLEVALDVRRVCRASVAEAGATVEEAAATGPALNVARGADVVRGATVKEAMTAGLALEAALGADVVSGASAAGVVFSVLSLAPGAGVVPGAWWTPTALSSALGCSGALVGRPDVAGRGLDVVDGGLGGTVALGLGSAVAGTAVGSGGVGATVGSGGVGGGCGAAVAGGGGAAVAGGGGGAVVAGGGGAVVAGGRGAAVAGACVVCRLPGHLG